MKKTTKAPKSYHLLVYVEDCTQKVKKFDSTKALDSFMAKFLKKYPPSQPQYGDSWLDYSILDVTGSVNFFDKGMELE